jgi:hypothetical protein
MTTSKYLNLFKALPVNQRARSFSTDYIGMGVLVEDSVMENYGKAEVDKFVKGLVPTDSQMNQTFHKSWKKVRDASIEQLVVEQIVHYFTTYGFEALGFYNEDSVYLPNERLELEAQGGITFYVLRGITAKEVADRVEHIITSGIALSDSDLTDLVDVIKDQGLTVDPSISTNREMKVRLYRMLNITPEDPVEYLRLQVYRTTDKTMLIKSKEVIEEIKGAETENVFAEYEEWFGLTGLASIFYRFKPIFLAFKNKASASTVNRIRKLAVKHHRPMPEDYLASVTKHLRNGTFEVEKLQESLAKTNVFRKVKLAQALRFYDDKSASGVVYSVRNGKSFATTINPLNTSADEALLAVMESLSEDLGYLEGKRIYMDAGLTVPTSGKMFFGDVPFGSHFSTKDSLVLGVSWKDVRGHRVDLDLSMISVGGKIGWDGGYRNNNLLFSGDITAAPNGATEAHLVRDGAQDGIYLLNLNYFNAHDYDNIEVPFTLFVTAESEYERMNKNAMMSQDNMLFWADSVIDAERKQKTIGVLKISGGVKTFHVFEFKTGRGITARNDDKSANTIAFYDKYLDSMLDLRSLLEWAGATVVNYQEEAEIDLSMNSLTKDALVGLLTNKS